MTLVFLHLSSDKLNVYSEKVIKDDFYSFYMWQSWIELKYYSVTYFKRIYSHLPHSALSSPSIMQPNMNV